MPKLPENFTAVGIVCHHFERLAVLQNELVKMLENVLEKLFAIKIKEKRRNRDEKYCLGLKKCQTSTNPRTVKQYEAGMCIGLFFVCQKSNQNRNVEAKNRESNRTVIIAINREFD